MNGILTHPVLIASMLIALPIGFSVAADNPHFMQGMTLEAARSEVQQHSWIRRRTSYCTVSAGTPIKDCGFGFADKFLREVPELTGTAAVL
jgi:hypothetical protein